MQPVNPKPPASAATFGRALKTFEQLSAKNQKMELLKDQAEKATGPESVVLNQTIRDEAK